MKSADNRLHWFSEARFGMFIHWGLYSILGRGEWVMFHEQIPLQDYAKLADRFTPSRFDPDVWVEAARQAGMKYLVFSTRHHDGFCLFDSQASNFTSARTAARRDFVDETVKACRRAGLKVGLYYSLGDWRFGFPKINDSAEGAALMKEQAHAQVRELMTQYGKIDILWYDGGWCYPSLPDDTASEVASFWKGEELNAMVRSLQPHILINNRAGVPGDFGTPEQHVTAESGRAWECCMTIGDERGWGYLRHDQVLKSPAFLIQTLAQCVSLGGNFLLNVSPMADGRLPRYQTRILEKIGNWMAVNGSSIHNAGAAPFGGGSAGVCTARQNTVYLHVFRWPGRKVVLPCAGDRIRSARLLTDGECLKVGKTPDGRTEISGLPMRPVDPFNTVIVLETECSKSDTIMN